LNNLKTSRLLLFKNEKNIPLTLIPSGPDNPLSPRGPA